MSDGPRLSRCSIWFFEILISLSAWPGSRRITASGRSSASSPLMVRPSSVTIVTVSYPFLIVFDGSRIDSTIVRIVHILAQRGQVGAQRGGRTAPFTEMALGAREGWLIKNEGSSAGITQASGIAGQHGEGLRGEAATPTASLSPQRRFRPDP